MVEFLCVRNLHVWANGLALFKLKFKKKERSLHQREVMSFGLVVIYSLLHAKRKNLLDPHLQWKKYLVIWCMFCAQRAMALWRQMTDWTPLTNLLGYETTEPSYLYRLCRCTFTFISPQLSCNYGISIFLVQGLQTANSHIHDDHKMRVLQLYCASRCSS